MKAIKLSSRQMVFSILQEKCPHCNNSKVFEASKGVFRMPVMKENCDVCQYHFDREPGYFLGAMYISYALAVLEAIVTFLVCYFLFPAMEIPWIPVAIIGVIILCAKKNYKLSRIIYMHLFPW